MTISRVVVTIEESGADNIVLLPDVDEEEARHRHQLVLDDTTILTKKRRRDIAVEEDDIDIVPRHRHHLNIEDDGFEEANECITDEAVIQHPKGAIRYK